MKKKKFKNWVRAFIFVFSIGIMTAGAVVSNKYFESTKNEESIHYVAEEVVPDNTQEVVETAPQMIVRPYMDETVTLTKGFYDSTRDESSNENAIIYYKNTYMQNTGALYTGNQQFDVVSVLDGTVTSITKDEILGNVVEVTHSNNLITSYQCLSSVNVKVGDAVSQNFVIGRSGSVEIDEGYGNALLFEVNYKGQIINPEDFYQMNPNELEA